MKIQTTQEFIDAFRRCGNNYKMSQSIIDQNGDRFAQVLTFARDSQDGSLIIEFIVAKLFKHIGDKNFHDTSNLVNAKNAALNDLLFDIYASFGVVLKRSSSNDKISVFQKVIIFFKRIFSFKKRHKVSI